MLTEILISKKATQHNLREFKKIVGAKVQLMPVIKANAYGHDFLTMAKICGQSQEVGRLAVVNLDEALILIKHKIKKPIQILSFFELDEKKLSLAIKNNVRFPLYDLAQARILNQIGDRLNKKVLTHLKIDVGTTRIGILPDDMTPFVTQIKKMKNLEIEGVFGHYSSSEDSVKRTQEQKQVFEQAIQKIQALGIDPKVCHIACTAASSLYPDSHFNTTRLGLGTYGLYPDEKVKKIAKLKPVLSWYTKIIQVKSVPAGTKVGYSGSYEAKKATRIAVLPVGYYDGYSRAFSNKARVYINGHFCPVRGKICMNLTMVEIPKNCVTKIGDRVELIGEHVTADELARISDTINYEIVTKINPLLPRIVI